MKSYQPCSRCGATVPNVECYVCASEPVEEDVFSQAKDAAFHDDEANLFDMSSLEMSSIDQMEERRK